jgi:hypothetical protein
MKQAKLEFYITLLSLFTNLRYEPNSQEPIAEPSRIQHNNTNEHGDKNKQEKS